MLIVSRASWGARAPKSTPVHVAPTRRTHFVVHHSGAPANQSVRAIQNWCMNEPPSGRGFADIDYNFLVDQAGTIYEGRGWDVVGAHTTGYNTVGAGVCIIGNDQLSEPVKRSVRWLYEAYLDRAGHGLVVRGHRQLATTGTTCPGGKAMAWLNGGMVVAPGVPAGIRALRLGLYGDDVRALQTKLGITADGTFGPRTQSAVMAFQARNGLAVDGVVGPATRAKLGLP